MKVNNLEKRKNNILIATLISVFCYILNILLFLLIRVINISLIFKIIIFSTLLLYILFILPNLLVKLQDFIYTYLCKNINIIENNLSFDYTPIFLNTTCLKKSYINLHNQRTYYAKLEDDGTITIKIENKHNNEVFFEQISDYSWFLSVFCFEE